MLFERLIAYSEEQRRKHHRFVNSSEMKRATTRSDGRTEHWRQRAECHLYKSKRALTLAHMLRSRIVLRKYLSRDPTLAEVQRLLQKR